MEAHRAADPAAYVDLKLVVVSQSLPESLARFLAASPYSAPIVGDPGRGLYHAVGLERVRWRSFLRPRVLAGYLQKLWRGAKLRPPYPGEDVRQQGGDWVLTAAGAVAFAHPSRDAADRAPPGVILAAARRAVGA